MLKDIFSKTKTTTVNGERKRYKIAYTTGDTPDEVSRKLGLMPGAVDLLISNSRHRKGWRLEDNVPFTLVVSLARVLEVPIAELLTPAAASAYRTQERTHPSVTTSTETQSTEPEATARKTAEYMTPQQIAEHMGISAKTVIRYIQAGELPAIHLGRRYVVKISDAKAWILSRSTL